MGFLRRLNLVFLAVAALYLFLMVVGIDWKTLVGHLLNRWQYLFFLLLPYGVTCYLWTVSWSVLICGREEAVTLTRLFFIRLSGESLNQLTPTASLGGEPFKGVALNRCGIPWQEATVSLVVHKVLTALSLVLYIFFCLVLVPFAFPGVSRRVALSSALAGALIGAGGIAFAYLQRHRPCTRILALLKRLGTCPAFLQEKEDELALLDSRLARFYRDTPGKGYLSLFLLFTGWLAHAFEVYLIFWILGTPIRLEGALCFDGLAQAFAAAGFLIPASLGVQDAGNVLLSLGFHLGATVGAAFSIIRRFREAFWLCLGLAAAREK